MRSYFAGMLAGLGILAVYVYIDLGLLMRPFLHQGQPAVKPAPVEQTRERFKVVDTQVVRDMYGSNYLAVLKDDDTGKHYILIRTGHGLVMLEMKP